MQRLCETKAKRAITSVVARFVFRAPLGSSDNNNPHGIAASTGFDLCGR
jgi:hypothetical protein